MTKGKKHRQIKIGNTGLIQTKTFSKVEENEDDAGNTGGKREGGAYGKQNGNEEKEKLDGMRREIRFQIYLTISMAYYIGLTYDC